MSLIQIQNKLDLYQVRKELFRRSYFEFVKHYWQVVENKKMVLSPHIELIANELQEVIDRMGRSEPKKYDLVINIPPAMSKSTLTTIMLPAWIWAYYPSAKIISTSYSYSLSVNHSLKSRDIILSDEYQQTYGVKIRDDKSGKHEYANTAKGERIATSIGGTITGKHGDVIIIDDPVNPKKALSEIERENANNYIKNTLNTRKTDSLVSVTIVVMQRLHIEDVSGLFLERDNVKHICLPAELSDNVAPKSARKIYKDGLLDPRRLSKSALAEFKANLGSYGYAGQYMQVPAPDGGGIWDSEWFQAIPDEKFPSPEQMTSYGTDWDLAYTKKEENSASAYVIAGKIGENIYIDKVGAEWLEFPELIALMKSKPAPHYIEAKASGKSAKQTLTYEGINAIEIEVIGSGDKIARARLASPTAEAGRIFIRASQKDYLINDSKQGIKFFPNGSHNDLADALSQSIMRLSKTYKAVIL